MKLLRKHKNTWTQARTSCLLFWISALVMFSCTQEPGKLEPKDTFIAVQFEDVSDHSAWTQGSRWTGNTLKLEAPGEYDPANVIKIPVDIPAPGKYNFWLMAALSKYNQGEENLLRVKTSDDSISMVLHTLRANNWRHPVKDFPLSLDFKKAGAYELTLHAKNVPGTNVHLDKMILTNDENFIPQGYAHTDSAEIVLPPAWAFGVIYGGYTNQAETIETVRRLVEENYPVDAYWIDSWFWDYTTKGKHPGSYIDFEGDLDAYPDMEAMWKYMENYKIKSGIWVWDAIQRFENEEVFDTFHESGFFKDEPFYNRRGWHNGVDSTLMGNIDFTNPAAVEKWKAMMKPFFDKGVDFLKLDRSSALPYLEASFELTQEAGQETQGRGYIMSHLHSTGEPASKRYPAKWTGDAKIAWDQPDYPNTINYAMGAFKENIAMVSDPLLATYDIPFLGNDTGGYNYFGSKDQSDELYMRWVQFSMFNPITNVFSTHQNPTANMPFSFSEEAQENFKYYAGLKSQLFPYIYTYAHVTRNTGEKMIRGFVEHGYQYLFGHELLVAPIYEQSATSRKVYLPAGKWYNYYSKELLDGGQTLEVDAPTDRIPLFARAGSIIPKREAARAIELGSNDQLVLEIYPGNSKATFRLLEDDGSSNDYLRGDNIAQTLFEYTGNNTLTIGAVEGQFKGMSPTRDITARFIQVEAPSSVSMNGNELSSSAWSYDQENKILTVSAAGLDKKQMHEITLVQ